MGAFDLPEVFLLGGDPNAVFDFGVRSALESGHGTVAIPQPPGRVDAGADSTYGRVMCKVENKYVVCADRDFPGYSDIHNAREAARVRHTNTDIPQIIYMAVEITHLNPAPIEFKKVDGVSE